MKGGEFFEQPVHHQLFSQRLEISGLCPTDKGE
jgi:hypothetical protein